MDHREREDARFEFSVPLPDHEVKRDLLEWWLRTAHSDFEATVPKMDEYGGKPAEGSADLILIGENLSVLLGMHDASSAMKQELGCWFYAQGKLARMVSNYQVHQPAKLDTLMDASVYVMMMRRLQTVGRWP